MKLEDVRICIKCNKIIGIRKKMPRECCEPGVETVYFFMSLLFKDEREALQRQFYSQLEFERKRAAAEKV